MLKTFSIGGVHPHENKLSAHQPIVTAEVPAKAVILLGQHIGAPAKPIVAKGDVVKVGTKIAEANGFVSTRQVTDDRLYFDNLQSGRSCLANYHLMLITLHIMLKITARSRPRDVNAMTQTIAINNDKANRCAALIRILC